MGQRSSVPANVEHDPEIKFATLGVVVLDELHFPSKEPIKDIVGGSGAYSTLGARLFSPGSASTSIGWMLRVGHDFPCAIKAQLQTWRTSLHFMEKSDSKSTRGRLDYEDSFGHKKTFKYLTPVLSILPFHLRNSALLSSRSFHFLADPDEIIEQTEQLLALRKDAGIHTRPLILWEPRPSSCVPRNLEAAFHAIRRIDVFSPNHVELAALCGRSLPSTFEPSIIEALALSFRQSGLSETNRASIVIRAGEHGCCVLAESQPAVWLPPYYAPKIDDKREKCAESAVKTKVVDPTGAGNAFLGAYAMGYLATGNAIEAACYGTVGASFAIEQIGLPELRSTTDGDQELWNGNSAYLRLSEYKSKLKIFDKSRMA